MHSVGSEWCRQLEESVEGSNCHVASPLLSVHLYRSTSFRSNCSHNFYVKLSAYA